MLEGKLTSCALEAGCVFKIWFKVGGAHYSVFTDTFHKTWESNVFSDTKKLLSVLDFSEVWKDTFWLFCGKPGCGCQQREEYIHGLVCRYRSWCEAQHVFYASVYKVCGVKLIHINCEWINTYLLFILCLQFSNVLKKYLFNEQIYILLSVGLVMFYGLFLVIYLNVFDIIYC